METKEKPKITTLQTICGGVETDVIHTDQANTVERVKVRQLPLGMMARFGDATASEPAVAMLCTDRDEEWFNSLTTESQEEIVIIALEINMSFFLRWAERQITTAQKLSEPRQRLRSTASA